MGGPVDTTRVAARERPVSGRRAQQFGRVVVDDEGIRQRRVLGLFGDAFAVRWHELTGWWVVDQFVRHEAVGPRLGTQQLTAHVLGLEAAGGLHLVSRRAGDDRFRRLVDTLRQRAPDKERPGSESPLARLRRTDGR